MMGLTHAGSGAAVGAAAAAALQLPPGQAAVFAALCAGGAVLPDIDHPDSSVARSLGVLTRVFARLVNLVSGGHRNGTHSGFGIGLFAVLLGAASALHTGQEGFLIGGLATGTVLAAVAVPVRLLDRKPQAAYATRIGAILAASVVGVFALTLAAATLWQGRVVGTVVLGAAMAIGLAAAVRTMQLSKGMFDELLAVGAVVFSWWAGADWSLAGAALVLGAVVHVLGDMATEGACPIGWPLSQRNVGLHLFRTGGPFERVVVRPAVAVFAGVAVAWGWDWRAGVAALIGVGLWMAQGSGRPRGRGRARGKSARRRPAPRRRAAPRQRAPGRRKTVRR